MKKLLLYLLCTCCIAAVLFAGLWPFNFFQKNKVSTTPEHNGGISFDRYGIVYSGQTIGKNIYTDKEITLEFAIQPKEAFSRSVKEIISFYSPDNHSKKISVSQWLNYLIIRREFVIQKGKKLHYREIGVEYSPPKNSTLFVTITSNDTQTVIYINGKEVKRNRTFTLFTDSITPSGTLILGNSIEGTRGWVGNMYYLSVYNKVLTAPEILKQYTLFRTSGTTSAIPHNSQFILYEFDSIENKNIRNKAGSSLVLIVPERLKMIHKKFLTLSSNALKFNRGNILDTFLNLLGFIPLGFILGIGISETNVKSSQGIYVLTLLLCIIVSLAIELLQVFLPSRDSSLLDLFLNTAGGGIGIVILHISSLYEGPRKLTNQ